MICIQLVNNVWSFSPGDRIEGKVVIDKKIWNKVEGLTIRFYGKIEVGSRTDIPRPPPTPSHPPAAASQASSSSAAAAASTTPPSADNPSIRGQDGGGCMATARKFIVRNVDTEEILLDHTINLLETWKVLKPGRHEFDFNFALPTAHLPPSLKISGARIHYEFITALKRPRDAFKIYQTPFYIISSSDEYVDENFDEYCLPAQGRAERNIAQLFGCCINGEVALSAELQRRIVPLGGTLSFIVNVKNGLRSNLDSVKVNLIRKFTYQKSSSFSTKEIVANVAGPILRPGEAQIWNGSLHIPSTETATNKFYHDLFEITHTLQFQVRGSKYRSKDATIKFALMILPDSVFSALAIRRPSTPPYTLPVVNNTEDPDGLPPTYDEATVNNEVQRSQSTSHLMPSPSS